MPARDAKATVLAFRNQPIAGVPIGVGAKAAVNAAIDRTNAWSIAFQREKGLSFRRIPQLVTTAAANTVLKIKGVVARLAGEYFHDRPKVKIAGGKLAYSYS